MVVTVVTWCLQASSAHYVQAGQLHEGRKLFLDKMVLFL